MLLCFITFVNDQKRTDVMRSHTKNYIMKSHCAREGCDLSLSRIQRVVYIARAETLYKLESLEFSPGSRFFLYTPSSSTQLFPHPPI